MIIHSNTILFPICPKICSFGTYTMLNVNIKLFFVENYIILVELYIGIYVIKFVHLFKRYQIIVRQCIQKTFTYISYQLNEIHPKLIVWYFNLNNLKNIVVNSDMDFTDILYSYIELYISYHIIIIIFSLHKRQLFWWDCKTRPDRIR